MMTTIIQPQISLAGAETVRRRYVGRVVYVYGYDIAYELKGEPAWLLGQAVEPFAIGPSKRSPRHRSFYQPQMVRLPPVRRTGPHGPVEIERTVKLLSIGAISVTITVPFEVSHVEDLVGYHDLQLDERSLNEEAREIAEQVHQELKPFCVRPVDRLMDEEAYTVFCIEAPLVRADGTPISTEQWLESHRRKVAALLTQETDLSVLSRQEAEESTGRSLSYYQNDLVVIDWDAALIVDEAGDFHETLYIMELANLQLAELEGYDRLLDQALERAYRDLGSGSFRQRMHVLRELRELRIDLSRLNDELSNITKFFGDWHLARIYENITARFHLTDWHRTIEEKLRTLDELYEIVKHDQTNRWMLMLEVAIVLLFIVDLVMLFFGPHG